MSSRSLLRSVSLVLLLVGCGKAEPEKKAPSVAAEPPRSIDARPAPRVVEEREPREFDVLAQLTAATEIVLYAVDPHHVEAKDGATTQGDFHDFAIRKTVACRQLFAYQGETKVWEPITRDPDAVLARYLGKTPGHDDPWP